MEVVFVLKARANVVPAKVMRAIALNYAVQTAKNTVMTIMVALIVRPIPMAVVRVKKAKSNVAHTKITQVCRMSIGIHKLD